MMLVEFQPSRQLYPFQSRWFNSEVGRVHYVDEGRGRPILLLHGNPTWSFLYRKMIPLLCGNGFRCIAPDYPGHGLSVHPDDYRYTAGEHAAIVLDLVRHLDLRDLLVVGQDWGGPVAVWTAAQEPQRIAGLILGSTFAWPLKHPLLRLIGRVMRSNWMHRYIVDKDRFVERIIRMMIRSELSEAELDHYRAVAPSPAFRRGIAELPRQILDSEPWMAQLERDARARLAEKPLLLFRTRSDRGLQPDVMIRPFQAIFPNHTIVDLASAGHFFQEDSPGEAVAAICARFQPANEAYRASAQVGK